ncbi:MAG: polysaccharide deacetylase [Proteobacteria bacterium]|nr:MAG: polysaccharide deacetylase [Pseudomonadota bacterium]
MKLSLIALAALLSFSAQAAPKPPQYVVLAFDGSKSLDMWNATRQFAKSETEAGRPLKFTYFINAVYYLADANKGRYQGPHAAAGRSAIGFGGSTGDVLSRFDQTNLAREEGNEIANHAAGHYDGSKWSEADWKNEFDQFYDLLFKMFGLNRTEPTRKFPKGWTFSQRDIIGFRAPQLGKSAGLFQALPQFGIRYDTSYTGKPDAWPKKRDGLWYFPLASIPVAGTGRKTLAMDYNFYYMQSGAKNNARNSSNYEELLSVLDKSSPAQLASYEQDKGTLTADQWDTAAAGMNVDLRASFNSFAAPALPAGFDEEQNLVMDPPEAHEE